MRLTRLLAFSALIAAPAAAWAQPMVQSQEGIALQNEIYQLQNQVQQLQANGGGGNGNNAPPPAAPTDNGAAPAADSGVVTSLLNQVQQLQNQVQQLSGQVDTLQNQVNTQHDATEKEIGDLNFKVTGGAQPGGSGGTTPPAGGTLTAPSASAAPDQDGGQQASLPVAPPALPVAPPPANATPPAKPSLRAAQAALAARDYQTAEANSRGVLAASRNSPAGYEAQYLLAQSLAGEGRSQDAAIAYDDTYNRDRTGGYAAGSLLGLANALTDIHQTSAACDTLSSLRSQFPAPPAGMAARIGAARRRAGCA